MSTVWAVARQMIAEGIRMKIALVFVLLIGVVVLGLPFSIRGDSSVTGAVQAFMSYAFSATGVLLGMLTIFMSRSLSDELVNHQILMVMTKPVPRWQYILGKWLGITTLNFAFLLFSAVSIYGMVYYIKASHDPIDPRFDMATLVNEVLVARHGTMPRVPDFTEPADREFQQNLEDGLYDSIPNFNAAREKASLAKKHEARWRIVEPFGIRVFEYDRVLCDRSKDHEVQLRYRTNVSYYPPDEIFRAWWSFGDAMKGASVYDIPTRHVIDRNHVIRFPADAMAPDQTLKVTFYNQNTYPGEPVFRNIIEFRAADGPELLFVVGSFGANMVRLITLMMCKLMFLAAVAILMTTAFSFPVACLTSFTVYVLAGARAFIAESLEFAGDAHAGIFDSAKEFFLHVFGLMFNGLQWAVPDFARYDAVETFVAGRNVSLVWVLQAVGDLALLKTMLVLGLAMLLFHRREVAEISL
ncbi:MAG: ABC transporter permease [Phycisphaerae bacterium]